MTNVKMVSPWVEYYRKVEALFKEDPSVRTIFDDENTEVKLFVTGSAKADAISQLLPSEIEFGNVTLKITVIPSNEERNTVALIRDAFSGNPALTDIFTVHGVMANDINYVIFRKEVVQYWNDDLSDAHGVRSTLYQNLANEVIGEKDGVFFCTDTEYENVGKPLGEWP